MRKKAAAIAIFILLFTEVKASVAPDKELLRELLTEVDKPVSSEEISYKHIEALKSMGFYKNDYKDAQINIRNAIIRFQSDCNLKVDAIPGKMFRSAIAKRMLVGKGYQYTDVIARTPSKGYWIAINRTKRILTLYRYKTVVKKYPIALGKDTTATPQGKFKVVVKTKNPMWTGGGYAKPVQGGSPKNPLGYRWIGLSVGKGYRYGIHGNNSPYSIGRNVSKGCIRMINSDVNALFEIVRPGTPVWIGDEETLNKWGIMQESFY